MKYIITGLLLVICALTSSAQLVDSIGCTGALGDIKYSILDEVAFIGENGDCWVLLDGRNVSGSELAISLNIESVPDARGYFFRCTDNRISGRKDPDRHPNDPVGSVQNDIIGGHNHSLPEISSGNQLIGPNSTFGVIRNVIPGENNWVERRTAKAGGSESRPKNITFYTYIRVN